MVYRAWVLTPWVGDGSPTNPYHPQVADQYPLLSWSDDTGQDAVPPTPNLLVVECLLDEAVLSQVQSQYPVLAVEVADAPA